MHCIQSQSQSTQDCLFNPKSPPSNNNLSSPHAFASNSTEKIKSIYSSRIFQQLIERLHEIGCKNKNQESIEQLMMNRFQSRGDETENQMTKILQDCLQFCVQQYHAKQQHLQIILEIATHFQHFIQAQSETITEQQSKIQFLQQQSHYRWVQCTQLHSCIDELEKQIQNMKNKSQNIIIQYQTEKYHLNHTNQAIKEVLRQTYESDREELSEVVKELQQELRSRTKKVKDMQNEVSQFHDQIMKKDKSIEQLKQENKDLKQQIRALEMNIQNLQQTKNKKQKQQFSTEKSKGQKLESQHFEKIKPEVKEAYSSSKLSDYIENIALPVTVAKKQEEICDSLPRERLRKMKSKSAGKNKEKNIEDIGAQKVIQDDYEQIHRDKDKNINKVSDKMNKNIKKMKSLALQPELQYICEPLELEDELTNNFHMPCSLVTKETQNEIEKQQRDEKYKSNTILERCLYKVKSIQRFSQVSEVGRFSNSLHFNLGELQRECESKLQPKSTNKVRKISIGLNTEPNQEQQFALEGLNSPSSPYKSKYNLLTSRSYQSHTGFDQPITFDRNIQSITDQSSSKNMNTKIKQIVSKLVSRRTHKKKEAQSIAQIEKRRKNERQARQKLSKSFVGAIQNIKDSLVGPEKNSLKLPKQDKIPFSSPNLIKKPSHRKNLSTSMINFSYPTKSRVSENTVPEPERNMKKGKNVSSILQIKQQGPQRKQEQKHQNKGSSSSIFSSIFDFAVKNRIKKN